jgi:hypothetical protein
MPDGCIKQASVDVTALAPKDSQIELVPIVPGKSDPEKIKVAISTISSLGGHRMSLWRRGLVSSEVWAAVEASRADPIRDCKARLASEIESLRAKNPPSFAESRRLLLMVVRCWGLELAG